MAPSLDPHCTSLLHMCIEQLLHSNEVLRRCTPLLPASIHSKLFVEAAIMLARYGHVVKESIIVLVSTWPGERFSVKDLLPDKYIHITLNTGSHCDLLSIIIQGLLNLEECCKLQTVDFTGIHAPVVFELPMLSIPQDERSSDALVKEVQKNCREYGTFAGPGEEEDLLSVLSWKINDMRNRNTQNKICIKGPVNVRTEMQLNLLEYMSIDTELLAISLRKHSPFIVNIVRVTVDNYHHKQDKHLQRFFNVIDKNMLEKLVIYGKRQGINLVMWDLAQELDQLHHLKSFGLGTSGPKLHIQSDNKPSLDKIFSRASVSFSKWTELTEIQFIGVILKKQLSTLLCGLVSPLLSIIAQDCSLHHDDLLYLSTSHHIKHLQQLSLEHNNLCNLGNILIDLVINAANLRMLNFKETNLELSEKVALMNCFVSNTNKLDTLLLYENEDMLTIEGYKTVLELACEINSLKEFYIFPLGYKSFDMFCREILEDMSQEILARKGRINLSLFY